MTRKILVVDDTRNVQLMLSDFLMSQNYQVLTASDGQEALQVVHESHPDLILLDIMMPNMDGYQFITQLRKESNLPVIMITARQLEADIVRGFDLGADDYITKPFRMRELLVRIRAVMRRSGPVDEGNTQLLINGIMLNPLKHEVIQNGHNIELTPLEFLILKFLMESAGNVVKHAVICMMLMENGYAGSESTLKIHIRSIRQKLGEEISRPKYIETIFGVGYRFMESAE